MAHRHAKAEPSAKIASLILRVARYGLNYGQDLASPGAAADSAESDDKLQALPQACETACINSQTSDSKNSFTMIHANQGYRPLSKSLVPFDFWSGPFCSGVRLGRTYRLLLTVARSGQILL